MSDTRTLNDALNALGTIRIPAVPGEYDLHALIASALDTAGIPYVHEARVAPRCRVDFLLGDVAIEVKKGKPIKSKITEQARRYLGCACVSALIVVTQKSVILPRDIAGKRVEVLSLDRLWGVALP